MIYLASPYSHDDPAVRDKRYQLALRATEHITSLGYVVFSPIVHSHPLQVNLSHEQWMKICLEILSWCSHFALLGIEGVHDSKGCLIEAGYAMKYHMKYTFLDYDLIDMWDHKLLMINCKKVF